MFCFALFCFLLKILRVGSTDISPQKTLSSDRNTSEYHIDVLPGASFNVRAICAGNLLLLLHLISQGSFSRL